MRVLAVLLAIVLPGFGQVFNKQYVKALILILGEHVVNSLAKINAALYLDINGNHRQALDVIDYQYALFYPALFIIGTWDAFANAKPDANNNAAYYFLLAGVVGTISINYSTFLPFPIITVGTLMIVLILVGVVVYRK